MPILQYFKKEIRRNVEFLIQQIPEREATLESEIGLYNNAILNELIAMTHEFNRSLAEQAQRTLRAIFDIKIATLNSQLRDMFLRQVN